MSPLPPYFNYFNYCTVFADATLGVPPEHLIAALLEQQCGQVFKSLLTETQKAAARARFEQHFGKFGSDCVAQIDNESIDAIRRLGRDNKRRRKGAND